jgi:hypothetical protein
MGSDKMRKARSMQLRALIGEFGKDPGSAQYTVEKYCDTTSGLKQAGCVCVRTIDTGNN